ncbi:(DL)-glycerol-3-phosphatase 2, partial [Mucuna pruriens]
MANPSGVVSFRRPIIHVVFDMDGLLLDTEKFYNQVQEIILARYNKSFDWNVKAKMLGKKAIEAARVFVEESGISDSLSAEQFLVEREDMLETLFPTCELMPGVGRLVKHLHAKRSSNLPGNESCFDNFPHSCHRRHFELKIPRHREIFSLLHHVVHVVPRMYFSQQPRDLRCALRSYCSKECRN